MLQLLQCNHRNLVTLLMYFLLQSHSISGGYSMCSVVNRKKLNAVNKIVIIIVTQ